METKVVELDLNDVLPNRFQPRIKFSQESIQELANSIKEHGVIQPIVVRSLGDKYEIIAGERRYKGSILAGKLTIPAIITNLSEKDSAEVALIENVQRKDLTPIEEAISYKKILDMGYLTQDELAVKLGKTQSTIANKLRLLNLDDDVQEALLNEQISERHARSLLRLTDSNKQIEMLSKIINERLTVRKADEEIDKMIGNENRPEVLNFNTNPEPINPQPTFAPIEELEVFNPTVETLNIPTVPIVDDSIPEILPVENNQPSPMINTNVFNPAPEVINSTVPPVSEEIFNATVPIEEFNFNETIPTVNNIPVMPIEEQTYETVNGTNDINFINPGYMDINKIENEATDIYSDKPLAPIDNFLKPTPVPLEPMYTEVADDEDNESAEDILVPGKFFNLMPEVEKEIPVQTINPINEDSFNFNLDINSLNNIENTNNLPSLENIDSIPSFEPMSNQNVSIEPIVEQPAQDIAPEPILNPLNNYNPIHENPVPLAPESNPYQDSIAELEIPEQDQFVVPQEINSIPEVQPAYENAPLIHPTSNGTDLKNAINMIRDFSDDLGRMGYIVDTEEFDFEDMYQVIFKINK